MRPPIRLTIAALLSIGLMLAPSGCRRRSGDAEEAAVEPIPAERSEGERQPMRLTDAGRQAQTPDDASSQVDDPSSSDDDAVRAAGAPPDIAIDPRDEAFAAHRLGATPRYPSDFVIGALGTSRLSRLERAAREYARTFLRTLLEDGAPPRDAFIEPAPGALTVLERLVSTGLSAPGVRVGRPVALPGGERSIAYRVLGKTGRAHGELILEMADGQWYTSDVQVITSGPGKDEPFDPALDSPRW